MRQGIIMNELNEMMQNYIDMQPSEKQECLRLLGADKQKLKELYMLLELDSARMALRILADASKKKQVSEAVYTLEKEYGKIKGLLQSGDAKIRKNAAAWIGACCAADYAGLLTDALQKEDTEFVRPSILLALGKTKSPEVLEYLNHYEIKNQVEKHKEEEKAALNKALSWLSDERPEVIKPETAGFSILLNCSFGQAGLTREELDEQEYRYWEYEYLKDTLMLQTNDYESVFSCRTFFEALILLGKCPPNLNSLASFLQNPKFSESILRLYGGKASSYRIEVKGNRIRHEDRIAIIETVLDAIQIPGLTNNPSSYAFELRIVAEREYFILLIKPSAELDKRFAYRQKTLPASIHPVTAACIMRHIYPFLKRGADVLDPFCGSGTMLFERSFIKPCSSLTGTDNQKYAMVSAKDNEAQAKTGAHFIQTDILTYMPDNQFDEIISNMPFGHRVGSHENNTQLYEGFVKVMYGILKPKGMAFLFTNDKTLLRQLIEKDKHFTILDEKIFHAGDLHPSLFIIEKTS